LKELHSEWLFWHCGENENYYKTNVQWQWISPGMSQKIKGCCISAEMNTEGKDNSVCVVTSGVRFLAQARNFFLSRGMMMTTRLYLF
jgi:hypothetical protein